ncbi:MAG: hypothetical protein V1673_02765 [Candidatus Omnitrophota bacterium]
MMEDTTKQETKGNACHCVAGIGALVIVLAWWQPSWGAIALTILGVMLIIKDVKDKCGCAFVCKPKT